MTHLGLRVGAGMLWAAALALLTAGSTTQIHQHQLTIFAWSMFLCFAGSTLTLWLLMAHVGQSEGDRNAQMTADAVGEVVGRHINDDSRNPGVATITRR